MWGKTSICIGMVLPRYHGPPLVKPVPPKKPVAYTNPVRPPKPAQPKKPVENQELWMALYEQSQKHTITWVWVKGHATDAMNNRVDQLANEARKKRL